MKPELFRVPFLDLPVHSYGAMIVLGFLLSIWFASREVRRRGLPPIVYDLGLVMLLSGLVGARIFYVALQYDDFVLPCEHGGGEGGGGGKGGRSRERRVAQWSAPIRWS